MITLSLILVIVNKLFLALQVISKKDQAQYWYRKDQPYSYISTGQFIEKFKKSHLGKNLEEELARPFIKSQSHQDALSYEKYSLTKWELFKACMAREFLLMKRNSFIYVFKSTQVYNFLSRSSMITLYQHLLSK